MAIYRLKVIFILLTPFLLITQSFSGGSEARQTQFHELSSGESLILSSKYVNGTVRREYLCDTSASSYREDWYERFSLKSGNIVETSTYAESEHYYVPRFPWESDQYSSTLIITPHVIICNNSSSLLIYAPPSETITPIPKYKLDPAYRVKRFVEYQKTGISVLESMKEYKVFDGKVNVDDINEYLDTSSCKTEIKGSDSFKKEGYLIVFFGNDDIVQNLHDHAMAAAGWSWVKTQKYPNHDVCYAYDEISEFMREFKHLWIKDPSQVDPSLIQRMNPDHSLICKYEIEKWFGGNLTPLVCIDKIGETSSFARKEYLIYKADLLRIMLKEIKSESLGHWTMPILF